MRFAEFQQALQTHYGEEAAAARHELYFLARRGRGALVRGVLAALRDAWLCWRLPRAPTPLAAWVALATLPGANGWGALAPCVADLAQRGIACSVLIHPRLRGRVVGQLPTRPAAAAWRHAAGAWRLRQASADRAPLSLWLVRCCVFRQRLWRGAWTRTLAARSEATLLLHNDFDLYAVAAQQAAGDGWRSVCVQHGLPTDEFFPVRAQRHLVWGPSSAQVFARHGVTRQALAYGPAQVQAAEVGTDTEASVPAALYLISQTHTPIYGRALAADFLALAQALAGRDGPALQILLHPEEVRGGHPYTVPGLSDYCRHPPHPLLEAAQAPAIVVGFCSTALLQAACRGHYVIGLAWPATASLDALAVGRPPQQVADGAALCALIDRLCEDQVLRRRLLAQQARWLSQTFASDPDWPQRLENAA
ncbi:MULTISPECIES: hypothetical protein [Pseudoxanthomonas]|uniref:Uncharacterized protein n=1 Tax=Pseudoxanthomonas winnipegensis TaxID=2480810 RepID=A0AAW8G988_9GAMM|nr:MULTISPECIES: hypothetical protein [Pseudoxanthomonas]MDQ1118941.1 hypothetical protein [Pseudoxanthomonas winnipegensis]MDQ1132129.1 hypothetical protein [Pseudoxanthomonas winnipegensis]MDR6137859.1 hypothetical protein [Pseudoxanthomonas sp. SORGH_AS_0997]